MQFNLKELRCDKTEFNIDSFEWIYYPDKYVLFSILLSLDI